MSDEYVKRDTPENEARQSDIAKSFQSPGGDRAAALESVLRGVVAILGNYMPRKGSLVDKAIAVAEAALGTETPLASADHHDQTQNTCSPRSLPNMVIAQVNGKCAPWLDLDGKAGTEGYARRAAEWLSGACWPEDYVAVERAGWWYAEKVTSVGRGPVEQPVDQVSEKPVAVVGNHDCEYESEKEDEMCKHCGLTSREAFQYPERNLLPAPPVSEDSSSPALQKELLESFSRAEHGLAMAKHSNTLAGKGYWKGELAVLHRIRRLLAPPAVKEQEEQEQILGKPDAVADNVSAVLQNARYLFTDAQMYSVLEGAINLFLEWRDKHGKDEGNAAHAAIQDIIEGLDAERELVASGEIIGKPTQVILSSHSIAAGADQVNQTQTSPMATGGKRTDRLN